MAEKTVEQVNRKARELFEKARAALERKNYDYAIETLLSALELEPEFLKARQILRAAEIQATGKKSLFGRGLKSMGTMPGVARARMALKKGNALEALRLAEEALRTAPTSIPALEILAEAGEAAGMPEVAVHAMETAVETHPDNIDLLRKLGRAYSQVDELEKAVACYRKIVSLRPNDQEAQKGLKDAQALRTMRRGKWDQAQSYREVLRDEEESVDLERESRVVHTKSEAETLLERLQRQIERQPDSVTLHRKLGDLYRQQRDYEKAIEAYGKALELEGKSDPGLERLITETRVQQIEARIEELRRAGGPEEEIRKLEDEKRAIRIAAARERVERYPTDLDFRYELAELLYEAGEIDEALAQYQQAQKSPQHRLASLNGMGLCFLAKGMDDLAVRQFETALEGEVDDSETRKMLLYNLATAYERLGEEEKAVERYKEIYQEDIGFRDVAAKIEAAYRKKPSKPGENPAG